MQENDTKIEDKILFNEPMKKHTSFKVGGNAEFYINVKSEEELYQAIDYAKEKNIPFLIIGNGSNILVKDKGIKGLVIKIDILKKEVEKRKDEVIVTVGAGEKIMALANTLAKEGISGFEELSGIPGTIGGAIYMNAGAYGKEMKDIVISTKCMDLDGKIFELSNEEQKFEYRKSIFDSCKYIILETKLRLQYGNEETIKERMTELQKMRKEKQPIEYTSAGSTFKRKEGVITAKLIDDCGLKGYQIGGAQVSEKHAGFIINKDNASAKDIIDLIKYVKEKVYSKYEIEIEEEIKIVGDD